MSVISDKQYYSSEASLRGSEHPTSRSFFSFKLGKLHRARGSMAFCQSVENNLRLLWLSITTLSDWHNKLAPLTHLIRSKTKTNLKSLAHAFWVVTCICVSFDLLTGLFVFFVTA